MLMIIVFFVAVAIEEYERDYRWLLGMIMSVRLLAQIYLVERGVGYEGCTKAAYRHRLMIIWAGVTSFMICAAAN